MNLPAARGTLLVISQVYPPDPAAVGQHLADALLAPAVGVPDLTLSDALNRWSTLDALLCEGNATLLSVIRATSSTKSAAL